MAHMQLTVLASLVISLRTLGFIILFLTNLIVLILIFMFIFMMGKKAYQKNFGRYRLISGLIIRKAVFSDDPIDPEKGMPLPRKARKLMRKALFRRLFTEELIGAKKNLNGIASENLKQLYHQFKLEKFALKKLNREHWHKKAKAIQELAIMDVISSKDEVSSYTNFGNELVRMEAQLAVVQFDGFEGLRFLDDIPYAISEWQQIKLFQKLSHLPPANVGLDIWLKSTNNSVVVFALRLARQFHHFEMYDAVLLCLDHSDSMIRFEAILCLGEIYDDKTSAHLISRFWREDLKHQLAIIVALRNIGSENDHMFLLTLFDSDNYEIKLFAARALAKGGVKGLSLLLVLNDSDGLISDIISQVKGEMAA